MNTVFLRVLQAEDKADALVEAIHSKEADNGLRFDVDVSDFGAISRSPFAYWVGDAVRQLFSTNPPIAREGRAAKQGVATGDDFRYIRLWFEVRPDRNDERWFPLAKGGRLSPFYADIGTVLGYSRADQAGLMVTGRYGRGADYYFRPGLTWAVRSSRFAPSALPQGCIFSHRGYSYFAPDSELLACLSLFNSCVFDYLYKLTLGRFGFPEFLVGILPTLPAPTRPFESDAALAGLGLRAWSLRRSVNTRIETSHALVLPALLQVEGTTLAERADAWTAQVRAVEAELDAIRAEIDERCFDLYGIDEPNRRAISEGLANDVEGSDVEEPAGEVDEADDEQDVDAAVDGSGLSAELVSWAVGVAFGRFDVRLATGERELPGVPGPFDPLPVCSPGMLVGDDGLPSTSARSGYEVDFPASGVLVDDPGAGRDLTAAVRAVFETVFAAAADAFWDEAAALLDPRGQDLRAWLRSGFFESHLKLYSKSRRKAPILWQLGTQSGRYSVWLYAQRLSDDSFFQLQGDVLAPKLAYEERQLASLVQGSGEGASAKERREIEAQEAFVEELRVLLEEVKRVAPLWKPTLDDGIVLVMAPLWRLVPHKAWQRELKKKWAELAAGKYDWAQLAMHLWPERVVPKCAEDRSLAIAHGLEDVFWAEYEDGKWQPRQKPTTGVEELIQERTSTAAKDAMRGAP